MPLFKTKEVFTSANYAIWKIDETLEQLRLGIELSVEDQARVKEISSEKRLKEFLSLRHCLKHLFGTNVMVRYSENGKPHLTDYNISVSFSHTDGFAGVIMANDIEVGLDLELKRENIQRIARRFMREEEKQSLSQENKIEHLLFYWGAKESIVKIEDNKKLDFLKNIEVEPFRFSNECDTNAYLKLKNETKRYKLTFEISDSLHISCGTRIEP